MANLPTLPVELLLQISKYLCPHCSGPYPTVCQTKSLSRLTRTCRGLRDILQPYLFHHYYHTSEPAARLLSFLRALYTRPDLTECVTSLGFHESCRYDKLGEDDRAMVEDCLARLGLPALPDDWHDHVVENRSHIPMEVIIASCPNLETLEIPVNPEWMLDVVESFPCVSKPIVLDKLRKLRVSHFYISGDHWAVPYGQIEPLLSAAPNLEQLTLPTLDSFYEDTHGLPPLEMLTLLDLDENAATPYFLQRILSVCPRLEKFVLYWIGADGYGEPSDDWSPMDVWKALRQARDSLRELTFESINEEPEGRVIADCLSTLNEFTKLEVLAVNGIALAVIYQTWVRRDHNHDMEEFVHQLFPSTVKEITLCDPSGPFLEAVRLLAQEGARQRYPNLRKISITQSQHLQTFWGDAVQWVRNQESLRRKFQNTGVELCIDLPPIPDTIQEWPMFLR
ncbi:uncharacterized protein ACLA_013240 [Aspergillus clavatus NRRL 1]|uniref:F-box domain protein n=1 Tax=Aspergillus clavatus (strain ATCC 1007 / CBS 513.65 / DSM 816 / NCTC 3887 / NRRL 1 / QM 1276 / 107) TaxID=344612 RepID=A1CAX1_ASPCL|nr:F-box domain protein [Aspergillus clavatus NRRL 1]EAW12889.1 F-box domain protein [Aspergillus clavatus NRRL 1]